MMTFLLTAFFIFVIIAAAINFRLGLAILILLLPAYLIRFNVGPLPSTVLELTFGAVFLVWLFCHARNDFAVIKETIAKNRLLFLFILLFFIGSLIAAAANPLFISALGIWRAYFLEPIILFLIIIGRQKEINSKGLIKILALSTLSVAVLAIVQKLSGQFYPPSLWDDTLGGRATSFFTTPNAIGLYLGPIIALALSLCMSEGRRERKIWIAILLLSLAAIVVSFSQGAWIAVGFGLLLFAYLIGYKKLAITVAAIAIIFSFIAPQLREAILFKDKAGQNRFVLWSYSLDYLKQSPRNFVLGSGLRRFFTKVQKPYYDPKELERLIYPHNIFLNFWLETGLLGMISFTGIIVCLFISGAKTLTRDRLLGAAIISSLAIFIIHGLVDVPYFKNDLAMLFWVIAATVIVTERKKV